MDKPMSMSVKDFLVRTLAVKMMVSEKTIDAIVTHQFQSANEALEINNSIEISGFGKFFFNNKKALKRKTKLEGKIEAFEKLAQSTDLTDQKRRAVTVTIEKAKISLDQLKPKITYED